MLRVSAAPLPSTSFADRKDAAPSGSPTALLSMSPSSHLMASAVLIVPILDEKHHGADLLMIPISDSTKTASPKTTPPESESRTGTPAAPTPPPKPELPEGCSDWDAYLSQKKSTATLPILDAHEDKAARIPSPGLRSPELNFKHSFESLGWRDCLSQRHRHPSARPLRRRPSAATVLGTMYAPGAGGGGGGGAGGGDAQSLRSAKRLSGASTLTANTVATAPPCLLSSRAYKRLSNASTLTTSSAGGGGKPRSIRRINRTRHLRSYYSDGSVLKARRLSVGISSMQGISEQRRAEEDHAAGQKRMSSASMPLPRRAGASEFCAPPPYPPPEKPLPSLPVMEVRELQTRERTRWRELLLKSWRSGISR